MIPLARALGLTALGRKGDGGWEKLGWGRGGLMDAEFQFRKVDGGDRHSVSRMDLTLLKSAFKVVKRSILCFFFLPH